MKNKILCFGLVLIFLASMCGCNAEKADVLESSDIADCSSSVSNTETSDETDTTVESEPEKATETEKTSFEPTSESNEPETAPTESKKPVEADKTDIILPQPISISPMMQTAMKVCTLKVQAIREPS